MVPVLPLDADLLDVAFGFVERGSEGSALRSTTGSVPSLEHCGTRGRGRVIEQGFLIDIIKKPEPGRTPHRLETRRKEVGISFADEERGERSRVLCASWGFVWLPKARALARPTRSQIFAASIVSLVEISGWLIRCANSAGRGPASVSSRKYDETAFSRGTASVVGATTAIRSRRSRPVTCVDTFYDFRPLHTNETTKFAAQFHCPKFQNPKKKHYVPCRPRTNSPCTRALPSRSNGKKHAKIARKRPKRTSDSCSAHPN